MPNFLEDLYYACRLASKPAGDSRFVIRNTVALTQDGLLYSTDGVGFYVSQPEGMPYGELAPKGEKRIFLQHVYHVGGRLKKPCFDEKRWRFLPDCNDTVFSAIGVYWCVRTEESLMYVPEKGIERVCLGPLKKAAFMPLLDGKAWDKAKKEDKLFLSISEGLVFLGEYPVARLHRDQVLPEGWDAQHKWCFHLKARGMSMFPRPKEASLCFPEKPEEVGQRLTLALRDGKRKILLLAGYDDRPPEEREEEE